MKAESDIDGTVMSSTLEIKDEFDGSLEAKVYSDTADPDPTLVLSVRHWHPYMDLSLHLKASDARLLGKMLIEHTARVADGPK